MIKVIRKVSVFKRLIISFLVLITLPTLAITAITYNTYTGEIEKNISTLLSYTNHNVAQSLSRQMQYYENLVYTLYLDEELIQLLLDSTSSTLTPSDQEDIKKQINHKLYAYIPLAVNSIFNLQIVTPSDQFTQISMQSDLKGGYLPDPNAFVNSTYYTRTLAFKGHPIWFNTTNESTLFYKQAPPQRPIADSLLLMQSIPNYHIQDSLGVIIMNIYLKELIGGIDLSLMNRSGHLVLVGPGGTMASINANLKGPIPANIPHLIEQIDGKLEGVFSTEIEGETCLVAFEKLSNSDFYVLNLAYFDVLIASAKNIRNFTLLTMVVVIIVAIGIAYLVTLSITLPLHKLQRVLGKLPSKGFNLSFDDSYNDEIGILGHHFNTMVQEIQELINKVYVSEIHAKNLAFKKKAAELNALQMQINPHFLYNTLDIIRWEVITLEEGNGKVSQMIESFSTFLRLSIPKHSELVPISEEIRHVESYLEVINYRYQHKVTLTHHLDYQTLHIGIPKLTLQPIIENCILHAFKGTQSDKKIEITSKFFDTYLLLSITDNGIGMPEEMSHTLNQNFIQHPTSTHESIGLYNVCERIRLYYGIDYGLSITHSVPGNTTLEIKIPLSQNSTKQGDS